MVRSDQTSCFNGARLWNCIQYTAGEVWSVSALFAGQRLFARGVNECGMHVAGGTAALEDRSRPAMGCNFCVIRESCPLLITKTVAIRR